MLRLRVNYLSSSSKSTNSNTHTHTHTQKVRERERENLPLSQRTFRTFRFRKRIPFFTTFLTFPDSHIFSLILFSPCLFFVSQNNRNGRASRRGQNSPCLDCVFCERKIQCNSEITEIMNTRNTVFNESFHLILHSFIRLLHVFYTSFILANVHKALRNNNDQEILRLCIVFCILSMINCIFSSI